jgi:hypothetical protein
MLFKMLTNVGEYNIIKCERNFKRMLSNVKECSKMLENVIEYIAVAKSNTR